MIIAALVALWVIMMALVFCWWCATADGDQDAAPAAPPDPWALQVAAFRAAVHDWDRRGGFDG